VTTGVALAIGMALAFAFTNGFNDAANAIATLVATRIARPVPAVVLAAVFNLLGPFVVGAAVADTVGTLVTVAPAEMIPVLGAGLTGAVVWATFTRSRGIPSSSSHALVGGLTGAALVDAGVSAVDWGPWTHGHLSGVLGVLIVLALAPPLAAAAAFVIERLALLVARRATIRLAGPVGGAQWVTSAGLAFSHGSNDAQKTVGIIAAILVAAGLIPDIASVPVWTILAASAVLTAGTALGGWTIVRTIGRRIYPVRPLDGLVSQSSSAGLILASSILGAPVSTSQVVASSVVGIGVGRGRWRHVRWEVVREIVLAWVVTLPAAAALAALSLPLWLAVAG
jgi:inorganic phosphate transporter, PiT family